MNELRFNSRIADVGCLVCRRLGHGFVPAQLHHVAENSSLRHEYGKVPLCYDHHDPDRTGSGFHGMGTKRFCKVFNVPGHNEYGLLVWLLEDLFRDG